MANFVFATEMLGLIFLGLILYGTIFETKHKSKKKQAFICLLITTFFVILVDAIGYLPSYFESINWDKMKFFYHCLLLLSFISPLFVYLAFLNYLYHHLSQKCQIRKRFVIIGCVYSSIAIIIALILGIGGKLFVVTGGAFKEGQFYDLYLGLYILLLAYTLAVSIAYSKKLGLHDTIAVLAFTLVPVIFIIVNMIVEQFALAISSLSISMLIIQTMIQSERETHLINQNDKTNKLAHFDELTGLLNRLAYSETCDNMKGDNLVGVLFADVNGLKYTNDHYGHKAGDKLISDFANLLLDIFDHKNVYRISGDEFVAIVPNVEHEEFDELAYKLRTALYSQKTPVAAFGHTHGIDSEISRLVDMAENMMYEDKKVFYEKFPELKR